MCADRTMKHRFGQDVLMGSSRDSFDREAAARSRKLNSLNDLGEPASCPPNLLAGSWPG
jgi:hypothetical protein